MPAYHQLPRLDAGRHWQRGNSSWRKKTENCEKITETGRHRGTAKVGCVFGRGQTTFSFGWVVTAGLQHRVDKQSSNTKFGVNYTNTGMVQEIAVSQVPPTEESAGTVRALTPHNYDLRKLHQSAADVQPASQPPQSHTLSRQEFPISFFPLSSSSKKKAELRMRPPRTPPA